jgi:hypothetical protein
MRNNNMVAEGKFYLVFGLMGLIKDALELGM